MNIVHVSHHYKPCRGGVETVIEELNKNLSAKGDKCNVLCLDKCHGGKKLAAKESYPEADVERISFTDLKYYKFAPFGLRKVAEADIIHVHGLGFFADWLAITKPLHRKPLVFSTHGGIFHTKNISLLKKIYFQIAGRFLGLAFDKVIAVSENDKELFEKVVSKNKIVTVENGVDWKGFSKTKRAQEKNSFLYFGRLSKNKGLSELIDAFALFCKANKTGKLVIAGSDFEEILPELREKVKAAGIKARVNFTGEVSDKQLGQLLSKAEFFVSASKYEGFGITVIEAMSAGLIPLLNQIPTFQKFTQGRKGFIVDFSEIEKAAAQMQKIASLSAAEKKKLSDNSKKFASQFDWSSKAKQYENVYKECIK